jgi:hypothetical protein
MGRPPSEVARWPADDVRLLEHYLAKQPAPIERVEIALARLTAEYVNVHRAKGEELKQPTDFMSFRDPWPVPTEPEPDYRKANRGFLQKLRDASTRMRPQ